MRRLTTLGGVAGALALLALAAPRAGAQLVDKRATLARWPWLENRDAAWLAERIPFFESPDRAIDATYYYRWELVTKHLVYGAPETGYTFTEFIDRPFWSGAYGAISCPLGHQMAEVRWLKDARIVDDFARYWFEAPGAQPRSYSNWYASAVWGTYLVTGDSAELRALLPYMTRQYDGWLAERWDAAHRMFAWDGLHDGMERSITSRQTDDIDEGAPGFRPTLNSYLYGDATAIARASALFGDSATARLYAGRARELRARVERELWDERRGFFLHQFAHDENDGVRALTRTYETGKYAGDAHGRELIGYVPWQFDLPQPGHGYERAWRLLMDTAYFAAPFGPTTTERHDPLFRISPTCCWWSGNSWPYATTQTLVAMANLLNDYEQREVTAADWMRLFATYTRTQRKGGRPYVAEGANPDDGSWAGFDTHDHSEHYFHSGYVDLVVTGVVGLRPRADDSVEVRPLAPATWGWFALDDVAYHGHRLSIVWDRDGARYHIGRGLTILADGRAIARAPTLGRLVAHLAAARAPQREAPLRNLAVNNGRGAYPFVSASYASPASPPVNLIDGAYRYDRSPANRWTTEGSPHARDTVTIDFGIERPVEELRLYPIDDGAGSAVRAPAGVDVEWLDGGRWRVVRGARRTPERPAGRMANAIRFPRLTTRAVRVVLTPRAGAAVGLSEVEAWARVTLPLPAATAAPRDLAFRAEGAALPRVTASFTGASDRADDVADGRLAFSRYSRNRWTSYGSPHDSDWVEIDLGVPHDVARVAIAFWGDGAGVKAPRDYRVEWWDGAAWRAATVRARLPGRPLASAVNSVTIAPVTTARVRVVLIHDRPAGSGITELELFAPDQTATPRE